MATSPFLPPLSGALFGGLVEVLGLPLSLDRKQMSGMCLSGEYVKDASFLAILDELAVALASCDLIELRIDEKDVRRALEQNAVLWDRLIGQAENSLVRRVATHPYASRPVARIVTIDAAMRVAAMRIAAGLPPPLAEWWRAKGPGDLIRQLTKDKGHNIADHIGTSRSRLREWYDDANPSDANLKKLAAFLHPDDVRERAPPERRTTLLMLRRHYAAWRLRELAERLLPKAFADECLEAFVALVNWFMFVLLEMRKTESKKKDFSETNFSANTLRLALDGKNYPITDGGVGELGRGLRKLVAALDQNPQWVAALRCDDLLYIQRHATNIFAMMLRSDEFAAAGAPAQLRAMFSLDNEHLWDPPVQGIVPLKRNGAPAHADDRVALASATADEHFIHGDYEAALEWRRRAVELDPQDAMAHFLLGELLGELGHLDEAIAHCRRATELDPQHEMVEAREGLAAWLNARGDSAEAERLLRATLDVIGEHNAEVELLYQLGTALLIQNHRDKDVDADRFLDLAATMNPEDSFVQAAAAEAAGRVGKALRSNELKKRAHHRGLPNQPSRRRRR